MSALRPRGRAGSVQVPMKTQALFRRLPPVLLIVVLAGCASSAPVGFGKGTQPPAGAIASGAAGESLKARASDALAAYSAQAKASERSAALAAQGTPAPAPPPPGEAKESDPPTPGDYTYKQTGSGTFDGKTSAVPPKSTLTIDPPLVGDNGTFRQHQHAGGSSEGDYNADSVYIYATGQVSLESVNPGGFTCKFQPPLEERPVPLSVGLSWESRSLCSGAVTTTQGRVLSEQKILVGSVNVDTFEVHLVTETKFGAGASGYQVTVDQFQWFSPVYRVFVKTVTKTTFKFGGSTGTSNITAVLLSPTPDQL